MSLLKRRGEPPHRWEPPWGGADTIIRRAAWDGGSRYRDPWTSPPDITICGEIFLPEADADDSNDPQ